MIAWGRAMMSAMNGFHTESESGLVRMFRIEYGKEYQHMRKMGYRVDDSFVQNYLSSRKS